MITLVHYLDGVNGSLISIIDYYTYLDRIGFDVELVLATDSTTIGKSIQCLYNSYNLYQYLNNIKLTKVIESDIIICSNALFFKGFDVRLIYDNLYVLDSMETTMMKYGLLDETFLPKDALYFCNPCNFLDGYHCTEYYHKIDFNRNTRVFGDIVYRRSYKPSIKVGKGKYIENINKTLFEHLYFGYSVDYDPDGKFIDDGLTYYLRNINVDDSKSQTIVHPNVNFLEFNMNDKLVKVLEHVS